MSSDAWAATGARFADFERHRAAGLVPEVACQACGFPTLTERGGFHVCVVCHWEDDGSSRESPDLASDVNHGLTLREAAGNVVEHGVSASPGDALTRPEFFLPAVRAARAALAASYEQLREHPLDATTRARVSAGRARLMRAIVNEMH